MRIAVISVHGCPCIQPGGTDAGGMNVYVDQVSKRLARLGYDIDIYSRIHADADSSTDNLGYKLVHIPIGEQALGKSKLPDTLPDFVLAVAAHATENDLTYDLIASHYWLSGVVGCDLSAMWEIPHVTSFHTMASIKKRFWPEEEEPEVRFFNEARVARDVDTVISWTEGEAEHLVAEFGVSRDKIAVVPPGVDTGKFSPSPSRPATNDSPRVLYVGRLDELKGVDLLIEAFAIVIERGIDADLQIVGGGSADEFRRVLGRISKLRLNDRVKLPGVVSQSQLPSIYAESDCIVAPSFHETFGLAVLEAASCGIPAVAADVDGLRAIVTDSETGFLIAERNPELYADKVIEIVTDGATRRRMSAAARKKAMTLSWDATVNGLANVYDSVVQTRLSPASLR